MSHLNWKIGDVRITRFAERETLTRLTVLLPEATPESIEPHASWLSPHFLASDGRAILSIHALLIESQGQLILVDTCMGEKVVEGFEMLGDGTSTVIDDMAAAGFAREQIDLVLCTHLHLDHVGWNTMRQGERWVPTFPNARYLFARTEWEYWQQEKHRPFVATLDDTVKPILNAGLADLIETDHKINDEVWLEATPGHTPGHVSVHIGSAGERAMITGDMTHHPIQWAEPQWKMVADTDAEQATRTRRRLIDEHANTPLLVIGTHYPPPCAGHLVRDEDGCRFEASKGTAS